MAGYRLSSRGKDLYTRDLVSICSVKNDSYEFKIVDDREDYIVKIGMQDDFEYHCTCEYNSVTSAVCEHCVAALHFVDNHKELVNFIGKDVKYLLDNYRNKLIIQAQSLIDDEKLQLEPIFELKEQTMSLYYRIGINKKYIVKDLHVFLDAIQKEQLYAISETETIYLSIGKFNDASKKLIDMLQSRQTFNQLDFYRKQDANRNFVIRGRNLDSFFAYGYQYGIKMKKEEKTFENMVFIPHFPKIKLSFEKQDNVYLLKHNVFFDMIERGNYGLYLLQDKKVYKGNIQYANMMEPLLQTLNNQEPLEISESLLLQFYNQILKQMGSYVTLEGDVMEKLINTGFHLKLHLDIDDKGTPFFKFFKQTNDEIHYLLNEDSIMTPEVVKVSDILMQHIKKSNDNIHYIGDTHDDFYVFVNNVIPAISEFVEIYVSDKVKAIRLKRIRTMNVGVAYNHGLLELDISLDNYNIKEIKEIINEYREKRKFYRLKDGSFLGLEDQNIAQLVEMLDDLGVQEVQEKMYLDTYKSLYINKRSEEHGAIQFKKDKSYVELIDAIEDIKSSKINIPPQLDNILRDYQKFGYQWLKTMQNYKFGAILADDMGIGKTLQVLALFEKGTLPNIVICPSSILFNWKNEITKFTPYLNALVVTGNAQQRKQLISEINNYDIIITSYDYLKRDIDLYENMKFHYQILDEAQYIKNYNTKNAVSVKQLTSTYRLALTGTPIENSLAELWSIMDFLMPNYLGEYHAFKRNYEIPIVKENDIHKQKRLTNLIAPFILRRMKKEVVKELPDKIETDVIVEFSEQEKQVYLSNVLEMKSRLKKDENKIHVLGMLTKLRQICNDVRLVYENVEGISSKMTACLDIIEQSIKTNKKVLLFSQFTSLLDLVKHELDSRHIKYYYLKGETSKILRQEMASSFNEDDTQVFLISLKAGGTGLNLTGAEVVIHFDPWWNISAQNQASDRAYRIGQDKVVQVFKLIMKDSIEEKILNIQQSKKQLSDAIIDENHVNILNMTTEEIMDLF